MNTSESNLADLLKRLERQVQLSNSIQTSQAGSTASAGMMTSPLPDPVGLLPSELQLPAPDIPRSLGSLVATVRPGLPDGSQKEIASPPNTKPKHNASDKKRLSQCLAQVCALQRQFGKTEGELETLVEGICWAIPDHPMDAVLDAIKVYIRNHSDIPAPNDLLDILDPPPPVYTAAMYIQIKKNLRAGNVFVDDDEKAYCRAYEKQEMAKVHGGSQEYRDAQRALEEYSQRQIGDSDYE